MRCRSRPPGAAPARLLEHLPDRRQVVRLVQGRQRHELLQRFEDPRVHAHGLRVRHAAVHDPMADAHEPVAAQALAQVADQMVHGAGMAQRLAFAPGLLGVDLADVVPGHETGRRMQALDLAAQGEIESRGIAQVHRELDARGTGVEHGDGVGHGLPARVGGCVDGGRSDHLARQRVAPGLGDQRCHRAGREAGLHRVGAAGEHDRHARAQHDAGGIGVGEEGQALGQHVAGLEVGHDQHVGATGHRRHDLLHARGLGVDGVVERERAIEDGPGDLAAIGHLAQRGGLDRRRHLGIDVLHRREDGDADLARAQGMGEVDGVLHDVDLRREVRGDVDRRVGDDDDVVVPRHVHDEAVADAARSAQAGLAVEHGAHQFIGVQAALHQALGLAQSDLADRLLGGGMAVGRVHDLDAVEREARLGRRGADPRHRPDQDRPDQADAGRVQRRGQRVFVAGVRDRGGHRGQLTRPCEQALVFRRLLLHRSPPVVTVVNAPPSARGGRGRSRAGCAVELRSP